MTENRPKFKMSLSLIFDVDVMTGDEEKDSVPRNYDEKSSKLEFTIGDIEETVYDPEAFGSAMARLFLQCISPIGEEIKLRMESVTGGPPVVKPKVKIYRPGNASA